MAMYHRNRSYGGIKACVEEIPNSYAVDAPVSVDKAHAGAAKPLDVFRPRPVG